MSDKEYFREYRKNNLEKICERNKLFMRHKRAKYYALGLDSNGKTRQEKRTTKYNPHKFKKGHCNICDILTPLGRCESCTVKYGVAPDSPLC